jgi:hypothetical protein
MPGGARLVIDGSPLDRGRVAGTDPVTVERVNAELAMAALRRRVFPTEADRERVLAAARWERMAELRMRVYRVGRFAPRVTARDMARWRMDAHLDGVGLAVERIAHARLKGKGRDHWQRALVAADARGERLPEPTSPEDRALLGPPTGADAALYARLAREGAA